MPSDEKPPPLPPSPLLVESIQAFLDGELDDEFGAPIAIAVREFLARLFELVTSTPSEGDVTAEKLASQERRRTDGVRVAKGLLHEVQERTPFRAYDALDYHCIRLERLATSEPGATLAKHAIAATDNFDTALSQGRRAIHALARSACNPSLLDLMHTLKKDFDGPFLGAYRDGPLTVKEMAWTVRLLALGATGKECGAFFFPNTPTLADVVGSFAEHLRDHQELSKTARELAEKDEALMEIRKNLFPIAHYRSATCESLRELLKALGGDGATVAPSAATCPP